MECIEEIIYPKTIKCNLCKKISQIDIKYYLCSECLNSIKFIDNPIKIENYPNEIDFYGVCKDVYSVCIYEGTGKMIVVDLKYKNNREIAKTIAIMLFEIMKQYHLKSDLIAYVPSHEIRLTERGYNQSEIIAMELSKLTGISLLNSLKRIKNNKQQVLFDTHERWYNVKDIFFCKDILSDKSVIIVDDVITTGATIYYASKELKRVGAKEVIALSFART